MTDAIRKLLAPTAAEDVFPELALSMFAFIDALHRKLAAQAVRDVYFLAREGQPMMRLFEAYQRGRALPAPIRCHYLEVSRRSTFLPSLGPLDTERFDTLFRQYRAISILEFLGSMGLEEHAAQAALALGVDEPALALRQPDLPTAPLYLALLAHPWFRRLYETERLSRRDAFVGYLAALSGGTLPPTLHLVDVGWKGTIQDNLHALLCGEAATAVRAIDGYYVGLVATGAATAANRKHGMLFSCERRGAAGFGVFNENRALFEVTLAADHGSVASYVRDAAGRAAPVRSAFEEESMVKQFVVPLQALLFRRFDALVAHFLSQQCAPERLRQLAARAHARMVFNPTAAEMSWFSTVFHVENFGVFENSRFGQQHAGGWLARFGFSWALVMRSRQLDLGFWPWLSIRRRSLPGFAYVYRILRGGVMV